MRTILLVEDEPTNMTLLSTYLQDANFNVVEASDGSEAWNILQKNIHFDVIITDRRMPNLDGLELAQRIKSEPKLRNIPIIMQTAAKSLDEVEEGIKAGVYYYLTKPYQEKMLITLTQAAIRDSDKNHSFERRLLRQKDALETIVQGEFHIRTPEEAENIAFLLGSLFPKPESSVSGLYELLINAIEHGNLKIGFEEKGKLLANSKLDEEIEKRLNAPENKNKKVIVQYVNDNEKINITITDQGDGFDWKPYLEVAPTRATRNNGRGIAKANLLSFDTINYFDKGNSVKIINSLKG